MNVQCPTCGATGSEPCIRRRKPRQVITLFSREAIGRHIEGAVWQRGELLGRNHDSRNTEIQRAEARNENA